MFETGLLVLVNTSSIYNQSPAILQICNKLISNVLHIYLIKESKYLLAKRIFSKESNRSILSENFSCTNKIRNLIIDFYKQSYKQNPCIDINFIISNIKSKESIELSKHYLKQGYQILITNIHEDYHKNLLKEIKTQFSLSNDQENLDIPIEHINLKNNIPNNTYLAKDTSIEDITIEETFKIYNTVCLGGTFDNIHIGHKILLTEASLRTDNKVIVGVTDGSMVKKKLLSEFILPIQERLNLIESFFALIKPSLKREIVPIIDIYGPSIIDPDIDCLVVSQETYKGSLLINEKRRERDLLQAEIVSIDVIDENECMPGAECKVSSSNLRRDKLGTLIKQSENFTSHLSERPYIIGLTGGIASGKTSVSKRLENLGAAIINCDLLGHETYKSGTKTFNMIIDNFGDDLKDKDGSINRKKLGQIVFSTKDKLKLLNSIVWPGIAELVNKQIQDFKEKGKEIIVVDAAVLLEAGWEKFTQEIWTTIIPFDEAVKRIIERNNLSEDQAKERINSQMSNEDRVAKSNVILCTLWEYDITQKQVEKAWSLLKERLSNS